MRKRRKNIRLSCNVVLPVLAVAMLVSGCIKMNKYTELDSVKATEEPIVETTIEPTAEPTPEPTVEPTPKIVYDKVVDTVFYGDSWMDNDVFRSKFGENNTLRVKGSMWAMYFVKNNLVTPVDNAKAVFVQFGLNDWQTGNTGLTENSYMKKFLDKLGEAHPNIPILITRSPHTGIGYLSLYSENPEGSNINPRCDKYSEYVKEYCDSRENYYYVDATSCLEDSEGWLLSEYVDSSTYHLTSSGYNVWFDAVQTEVLKYLNNN